MRWNDFLGFLIDTAFAWFFLRRIKREDISFTWKKLIGYIFLLCIVLVYQIGMFHITARIVLNVVRYVIRILCYYVFCLLAFRMDHRHSLYYALYTTMIYTLLHNIFLTPHTRPFLMGEAHIAGDPILNSIICFLIVYIIKILGYFLVYRFTLFSTTHDVSIIRYIICLLIAVASLYIRSFQQIINERTDIDPGEAFGLSTYFIISQLVFLALLIYLENNRIKTQENIAFRIQQATTDLMIENLQNKWDDDQALREFRHDIKNHLVALKVLLNNKEYQQASDYLDTIQEVNMQSLSSNPFNTGNRLLDGMLAQKLLPVINSGAKVNSILDLRKCEFIDNTDLCIIMGNLIDNAVEGISGVENIDDRFIRIKGGVSANCLICGIENSCKNTSKLVSVIPQSTKKNPRLHGFGLKNVKRVLAKYNGEMELSSDNGIFKVSIIMPNGDIDS